MLAEELSCFFAGLLSFAFGMSKANEFMRNRRGLHKRIWFLNAPDAQKARAESSLTRALRPEHRIISPISREAACLFPFP